LIVEGAPALTMERIEEGEEEFHRRTPFHPANGKQAAVGETASGRSIRLVGAPQKRHSHHTVLGQAAR
jgi:hypothetical protein